jgi:hypothetical protein
VHQEIKLEEKMSKGKGCRRVTTDHITHGILLESELVCEVKEDILYFLRGDGYLAF